MFCCVFIAVISKLLIFIKLISYIIYRNKEFTFHLLHSPYISTPIHTYIHIEREKYKITNICVDIFSKVPIVLVGYTLEVRSAPFSASSFPMHPTSNLYSFFLSGINNRRITKKEEEKTLLIFFRSRCWCGVIMIYSLLFPVLDNLYSLFYLFISAELFFP